METLREWWEEFIEIEGPLHLLYGLAIAGAFLLLALLLRAANRAACRRLAKHEDLAGQRRQDLLLAAEKPIVQGLVVLGVYLGSDQLPFVDRAHEILNGILFVVGAILLTRGVSGIIRTLVTLYGERVAARHNEPPDVAFFSLLRTLAGLFVWLVGMMIVLHRFRIDIGAVLAALGVGSVAIGLAAKDTLGNMIAGFIILLDRPFREGDRVKLVSGEVGDVKEIGLRSTKIQLFDDTYLVVPNNELVNLRIVNYAYPTRRVRGQFPVLVEYGVEIPRVKQALLEVLQAHPEVLSAPPPVVDLNNLTPSAMEFTPTFWVDDYARVGPVTEVLRAACVGKLAKAGVPIALPAQIVHLRGKVPPA